MACKLKNKKIMVCDTNKSFFNFIKKNFSQYEFVYYNKKDSLVEYDFLIFFRNKTLDCFEFLNSNKIKKPVIVAIFDDIDLYSKIKLWEKGVVRFIRTSKSKIEIKNELKLCFEQIED